MRASISYFGKYYRHFIYDFVMTITRFKIGEGSKCFVKVVKSGDSNSPVGQTFWTQHIQNYKPVCPVKERLWN